MRVAILGLGPSLGQYLELTKRMGARSKLCDETWGINAVGDIIKCDRVFHMDDVRVQQRRADAAPESNIAAMLGWLRTHPGPVYTSIPSPEYPGSVAYPLEAVAKSTGQIYWNSTAAYAVALAIHEGATEIQCFGMDFTYPDAHDAEKGRGCVEFWLGFAAARGIKTVVPKTSTLLDACYPATERFYGYDMVHVERSGSGADLSITFRDRDDADTPTAEEIEARYDHSAHPNALVTSGR